MPWSTGAGRPAERSRPSMTARVTRSAQESHRRTPGLDALGLAPEHAVHWNLRPAGLYEHAARRGEGVITEGGAFCAVTSPHTGRSPNDKFIVRDAVSEAEVWWGHVNQAMTDQHFERLRADVVRHLNGQELFVRDLFAGADPNHRIAIRFVTPNAWHALFVYNMFLRPTASDLTAVARGRVRDLRDHAHVRHGARERGGGPGDARERPRVRGDHGEYSRLLPDSLYPEARRRRHGGAPVAHRVSDVRRLRDHAADRAALARPGDVPFPLGLHRQGGGDGAGSHGAGGRVLRLLRRSVPAAASQRLRRPPGGEDGSARRAGLAREHRVVGRPVRRRTAHATGAHSRHGACRAGG